MAASRRSRRASGPPADKAPLPPEVLASVAERFRVLGTESRLRILNALMEGPRTVGDLVEATGLEQSNLSRHLASLEQAGCVGRTREGRTVTVTLTDPSLRQLCEVVCGALKEQAAAAERTFRGI